MRDLATRVRTDSSSSTTRTILRATSPISPTLARPSLSHRSFWRALGPVHRLLGVDRQKLDLEHERRMGRDAGATLLSVGQRRGNREPALLSHLHPGDALIPALDDLPGTEREIERLISVARAVELLAVREGTHVVHA